VEKDGEAINGADDFFGHLIVGIFGGKFKVRFMEGMLELI
jgi:hypothetical protein